MKDSIVYDSAVPSASKVWTVEVLFQHPGMRRAVITNKREFPTSQEALTWARSLNLDGNIDTWVMRHPQP
jgi:hypothetical protein